MQLFKLNTGVGKSRFTVTFFAVNEAVVITITCMSFSVQTSLNLLLPAAVLYRFENEILTHCFPRCFTFKTGLLKMQIETVLLLCYF